MPVVGVVRGEKPNVVTLAQKLVGQSLDMPSDTTGIRVRVRGDEPYAHRTILNEPCVILGIVAQRSFVKFTFVKVDPAWRRLPAPERAEHKREFAAACREFGDDHFLRAYSTVGTRGDCDLMVRAVCPSLEPIHELHVLLNQSGLMRWAEIPHSYLAMTKESVYSDEPSPLEPRPGADSRYLIVYPMWKKREWYALPEEERMRIMRSHIEVGRRHGTIDINTAYSFGLDDQEFVVSFDTGDPGEFLDLVQELRGTESSAYTLSETPIFTCISASIERALDALDGEKSATSEEGIPGGLSASRLGG
jgi:chlorite dismutase